MLKKSISILNSVLPLVILTFLIEALLTFPFIKNLGIISFVLLIPLKIIIYSGCYGSLFEIVSGEEMIIQCTNFTKNIKSFWKEFTILLMLPSLIYFPIVLIYNNILKISLPGFYTKFEIFIIYILILIIFKKKYKHKISPKKIKAVIYPLDSLNIIFLYILSIAIFHLNIFPIFKNIEMTRILILISRYLNLLLFLYLSSLLLDSYPEIERSYESKKELFLIFPVDGKIINSMSFPLLRVNTPVFTILKALTPPEYVIRKFNKVIWRKRYYKSNRLVAITCFTSNCYEAYKIAKKFKSAGSKVIMGGPHISLMPDEALEYCDSVVIGEAENIWQEVVHDYENNTLKKIYKGTEIPNFTEKTYSEFLNSPCEIIEDALETTRGCKFKCDFCTIVYLKGRHIRKRPIAEIVELIKKIKTKTNFISFIDNNIYSDPQHAKELFKALKPLKIKWRAQCSIDIAKDDEALQLAKESDCQWLLFGYEIIGDSEESKKGGKFALANKYIAYTKKVQNMGIEVKGQFVFGFENDTFKTFLKMWKFCFLLHPEFASVSFLTPLPGSKLFNDLFLEDSLTNLNWRAYDLYTLVFKHKKMNGTLLKILFQPMRILILLTTSLKGFAILLLVIVILTLGLLAI